MSYFSRLGNALFNRPVAQRTSGASSGGYFWGSSNTLSEDLPKLTQEQVLQIPAVTACVDKIASSISMLPLRTHTLDANGNEEMSDNAVSRIINHQWDSRWTRASGMYFIVEQAMKHGSAFVKILRQNGKIVKLTPIPSSYIEIERVDGVYSYKFNPTDGSLPEATLRSSDIIDIVFKYEDDGFTRRPKLKDVGEVAARYSLQARNARRTFITGATTHAIIFPAWADLTSDTQQLNARKNMVKTTREANESGSPYTFFEHGTEVKKIGIDPSESQLIDQQLAMTQEIARALGIPPTMIGDLSKGTFNNTEQSSRQLLSQTLQPLITIIEQEFNAKLFPMNPRRYVEFDYSGFVRSDNKTNAERAARLVTSGIATQNEGREMNGLPRLEGEEYDTPHQQAQMLGPEEPTEEPAEVPATTDNEEPNGQTE